MTAQPAPRPVRNITRTAPPPPLARPAAAAPARILDQEAMFGSREHAAPAPAAEPKQQLHGRGREGEAELHALDDVKPAAPAARSPQQQPPAAAPVAVIRAADILDAIQTLHSHLDELAAFIEAKHNETRALIAAAQHTAAAPAAAPSQPGAAQSTPGSFRDFTAFAIRVGISETSGKRTYKATGQPFTKFGVMVWPEVLALLGIADGEALKFGDNPLATPLHVRAIMGDKGPQKIIGLAPAPAAAASDSVPF